MSQIKDLKDLFKKFSDEQVCRDFLVKQRWNGVPTCPHCGSTKSYVIEDGKRFKCGNQTCYKKYSVTVGTVFEASNIPLTTWFPALYLIANHKKGISSVQLAKDLGVTQKTAWFMLHRIREALRVKGSILLDDVVQADEVYVGGKNRNRHAEKKVPLNKNRSYEDKTPVLGLMHQSGYVTATVIPNVRQESLAPVIRQHVKSGAILVTDEHGPYKHLDGEYKHVIINHAGGSYARGAFHTNTIEGFWAIFKRGYVGIYHYMSRKHLSRYFDEYTKRYNTRKMADGDRFALTLTQLEGRLSYKMLVYGKGIETIQEVDKETGEVK